MKLVGRTPSRSMREYKEREKSNGPDAEKARMREAYAWSLGGEGRRRKTASA